MTFMPLYMFHHLLSKFPTIRRLWKEEKFISKNEKLIIVTKSWTQLSDWTDTFINICLHTHTHHMHSNVVGEWHTTTFAIPCCKKLYVLSVLTVVTTGATLVSLPMSVKLLTVNSSTLKKILILTASGLKLQHAGSLVVAFSELLCGI